MTADGLAAQAREIGLNWQRSTVASIETGKRRLTGEELLLLPLLLSMALPVRVSLRDLLEDEVALTEQLVMTPGGFRQLLGEATPVWGGYKLRSPGAADRQSSLELWQRIQVLWPSAGADRGLSLERLRAVERSAAGDAEQNAARTLGCTAVDVAAVAHRLWGHGLTEERERRLAASSGQEEPAVALRVRRGHVTRALVDELAPLLTPTS